MNRTDRLQALALALQVPHWQRAEDLARALGVSARTIYRDVQALEAAGVPVVAAPGWGYRLSAGYFLPPLLFTTDEALVLRLGAACLAHHVDERLRAAAHGAAQKVAAALPAPLRAEAERLEGHLRLMPVGTFGEAGRSSMVEALRAAVAARRRVQLGGPGAAAPLAVDPYALVHQGGAWTLLGFSHAEAQVRAYRVDRIERLDVLATTFERPPGYGPLPEAAAGPPELVVRLLFTPEAARWVEEAPEPFPAERERRPDGLLLSLRVCHEAEVLPWLLSWGAQVRVLEPEVLRRRLAHEAERIAAHYEAAPALLA